MRILAFSLFLLIATGAFADDGELFRRNVSKTPDLETEHAYMKMLELYVPAQSSDGTLLGTIQYKDAEGAVVDERTMAKPLISFYGDGDVESVPDVGFPGHGQRDIFGAVSLDDGATWKRSNLSNSGDLSSFTLKDGTKYPGDVIHLFSASAGNKVLAVWASRYAKGGSPNYAMDDDQRDAIAAYLGPEVEDPYLNDLFGVAGSQDSSDFADEGYPTVGEVPYCALWAARGTLEEILDENEAATGKHEIVWRKAERLTSGVRDVHRVEAAAVAGAGFVVTWQEDPDGLRPGKGEGPGEGWSGAIAHHQTDIWYSYIAWDHFDLVDDEVYGAPIPLADYAAVGIPPVGIPMSMPVRLTDNAKCQPGVDEQGNPLDDPYCLEDFDGNGTADFCADTFSFTNSGGTVQELCGTEDGRVLIGNIAATRARLALHPYTTTDGTQSAWVVLAYEESKGLGSCEDEDEEPVDIGKNIWYHSFDMFDPEVVSHGNILNQPAVDPETGVFFPLLTTLDGYEFYETEIARRFSLISQPASKTAGSGTVALAMWKQGIINQGGPSDVYARRFELPDDFVPGSDNPFAFENMACDEWAYDDGSNPYYPRGICLDTPVALSATTPTACDGGENCSAVTGDSPTVDLSDFGTFVKVEQWEQTVDNLDDQSWENPLDVAKGHRGFMDGDFIMTMYAWSPNWLANTVGHDNYNLYIRRSFDGGQTWTTTPATLGGDGTTTCENYRDESIGDDGTLCTDYGPGEFEPARNVSQLIGTNTTILDPRYTPTTDSICDEVGEDGTCTSYPHEDDERDPSKFFIVYETGDNSTVAEGEATPLNLYYSRATNWGDDYALVDTDGDETGDAFDWLENKKKYHSGEASVIANPGGTFFYAVWNQWQEDQHENVFDSDAWFRRVMFIDSSDDVTVDDGGDKPDKPPKTKKVKP